MFDTGNLCLLCLVSVHGLIVGRVLLATQYAQILVPCMLHRVVLPACQQSVARLSCQGRGVIVCM
jgi:hypothetical protein